MTETVHYLLVVYVAQHQYPDRVPSGHVAAVTDRAPATTTEALQRLEDRGVVDYEPYDGVTLTPAGEEWAADAYETFVVLSRFFADVLEIENNEREALEAVGPVSPDVSERIASMLLSEVTVDPTDPPSILTRGSNASRPGSVDSGFDGS
jgi:Mn-dependent DtxR family transcriptional regulator